MGGYGKNGHKENGKKLMFSEKGKDTKKRVAEVKQSIVAGMQIDGISQKSMKYFFEERIVESTVGVISISALPSWLPPPTPAVGAILSSNLYQASFRRILLCAQDNKSLITKGRIRSSRYYI